VKTEPAIPNAAVVRQVRLDRPPPAASAARPWVSALVSMVGLAGLAVGGAELAACSDSGPDAAVDQLDGSTVDGARPDGATTPDGAVVDGATDGGTDAADSGPADPTVCTIGATWKAPVAVPLGGFASALLGSVSPDELHMTWTADVAGTMTVSYVDRDAKTSAFGTARTFTGTYALDRAAVSSDGLVVYMVRADRRGFVQRSRAAAADPFGPEETAVFTNIDDYAATTMPAGETFGDPVLAQNNRSLLYSQFGAGRTRTMHATFRLFDDDAWPVGQPFAANAGLDATTDKRRRPTALSVDGRTLFFFDEVSGVQRMAWNKSAPDDFAGFVDLTDRPGAVPNDACDRLYFMTGVAAGVGSGVSSVDRN